MTTSYSIEIEADTLEEARKKIESKIPEGLSLLSEKVISDGTPKTIKETGETEKAAFAKAESQIPKGADILDRKVLSTPKLRTVTFKSYAEENMAHNYARTLTGDHELVKSVRLVAAGEKRLFGLSQGPHLYEAEIMQAPAYVVEITYRLKVKIAAVVGTKESFFISTMKDVDRVAEEMGELYFQCPRCGVYERVNNIGKMMIKANPTHLTSYECAKCHHVFNARSLLKEGKQPDAISRQDESKGQVVTDAGDKGGAGVDPWKELEDLESKMARIGIDPSTLDLNLARCGIVNVELVPEDEPQGLIYMCRLLVELAEIGRNESFLSHTRSRKIGEELDDFWEIEGMRAVYNTIKSVVGDAKARELEIAWNGIGDWRL